MQYEPAIFRSALAHENHRRSPFTAQQEYELWSESGVAIVVGCRAAGIGSILPFVEQMASIRGTRVHVLDAIADAGAFRQHLQKLVARDGPATVIVVGSGCAWTESWIDEALERTSRLHTRQPLLRVLFVADPGVAWQLVRTQADGLDAVTKRGCGLITLRPWHDAFLRQWLDESGFMTTPPLREQVTLRLGNWPVVLERLYDKASKGGAHRFDKHFEELSADLATPDGVSELTGLLGLDCGEPAHVLRDVVALGAASAEDLVAVSEGRSGEQVQAAMRWAEVLRLATPGQGGAWRADVLVGRVLSAVEPG